MLELKVDGMTCEHCVRAVTQAVHAIPGAGDVTVDLATGRVRVQGSPEPAAVRAAIENEGYEIAGAAMRA